MPEAANRCDRCGRLIEAAGVDPNVGRTLIQRRRLCGTASFRRRLCGHCWIDLGKWLADPDVYGGAPRDDLGGASLHRGEG